MQKTRFILFQLDSFLFFFLITKYLIGDLKKKWSDRKEGRFATLSNLMVTKTPFETR